MCGCSGPCNLRTLRLKRLPEYENQGCVQGSDRSINRPRRRWLSSKLMTFFRAGRIDRVQTVPAHQSYVSLLDATMPISPYFLPCYHGSHFGTAMSFAPSSYYICLSGLQSSSCWVSYLRSDWQHVPLGIVDQSRATAEYLLTPQAIHCSAIFVQLIFVSTQRILGLQPTARSGLSAQPMSASKPMSRPALTMQPLLKLN